MKSAATLRRAVVPNAPGGRRNIRGQKKPPVCFSLSLGMRKTEGCTRQPQAGRRVSSGQETHPVVGGATVLRTSQGEGKMSRKKSRSSGFEVVLLTPPFRAWEHSGVFGAFVARYSGANRPGFTPGSLFSHNLSLRALFCEEHHNIWCMLQRTAQYVGHERQGGQWNIRSLCGLQREKN